VLRTVLYATYFVILLLLSQIVMLLPYFLLRLIGLKKLSRRFLTRIARLMGRLTIGGIGAPVSVSGLDNLPGDTKRICIVANHQSLFDIPLVAGYVPLLSGFIAKAELKKIPFLNFWLFAMDSVLLNRKSPHSAIKAINNGVEQIKEGRPVCIFPEGTRSRSPRMGTFKQGSLKLALRSKAVIVPLTIQNSYKLYEGTGRIRIAPVSLTIHPPVHTADLDQEEKKKLSDQLQTIIGGPLAVEHE